MGNISPSFVKGITLRPTRILCRPPSSDTRHPLAPYGGKSKLKQQILENIEIPLSAFDPGSSASLEVAVKESFLTITVNGKTFSRRVIKASVPFTPKLTVSGTAPPAAITANILTYSIGTAKRYNPILSTTDAYGPSVASAQVNNTVSAGGNVLTFASIPSNVVVGMLISDVDQPNAIPANTTVGSISSNTITLGNGAVVVGGIGATDNISFGPATGITGGNGINHDASPALTYAYETVIRSTNLCLVCFTENGSALASRVTSSPLTGATIVNAQGVMHAVRTPAGTIAALTETLPPNPTDGQVFDIVTSQTITALTAVVSTSPASQTIIGGTNPSTLSSVAARSWRYNLGLNAWTQLQ